MTSINSLLDLLFHHVQMLFAAEGQIEKALPAIIEKASHSSLKNALKHHASLTNGQKERLLKISELLKRQFISVGESITNLDDVETNKGIQGLIEEANETLQLELSNVVTNAVVISVVQKIEHYEIASYGSAIAHANQLNLHKIAALLNETLQEEYDVDDLLTSLATAAINKEAVPPGLSSDSQATKGTASIESDEDSSHAMVSISERTINSPGGRAGTSHRRYGNGESRGH